MIDQLSEQEQRDMVRRWWHQYGVPLLIAIIIGSGLGFGWRYYKSYQTNRQAEASAVYTQVLVALQKKDMDAVKQYADKVEKYYPSSPYASLTRLLIAKDELSQKQFDKSLVELKWVEEHARIPALQYIASLRSARIHLEEQQFSQALAELKTVDDTAYSSIAASIRGDVYTAQGEFEKANKEYAAADKGFSDKGVKDPVLTMKLKQLPEEKKATT